MVLAVLLLRQQAKLTRGPKDKEPAISRTPNTAIAIRALDGVSQDVRSHGNTVECAAAGLGDAGAAIRNNGDVLHTISQACSVEAGF